MRTVTGEMDLFTKCLRVISGADAASWDAAVKYCFLAGKTLEISTTEWHFIKTALVARLMILAAIGRVSE